jgi:hypothetical protein
VLPQLTFISIRETRFLLCGNQKAIAFLILKIAIAYLANKIAIAYLANKIAIAF